MACVQTSEGSPAAAGLAPGCAEADGPAPLADLTGPAEATRHGGRARSRVLPLASWMAATGAAFAVYLRLAQTRAVNSDGAAQALQAWDMLHGNPLLRGWTVSDVSFYTTELPQYALVELVRGLRADVVPACAAMTYTLVVLLAALVAVGRASSGAYRQTRPPRRGTLLRVALAAGILLAPQLGSGTNELLSSPDHIGTCVPLLLTWLVLDRAGRRWYVPAITTAALCLAEVSDTIALIAGIIPLALVCAVRAARLAWRRSGRDARYELAMGCGALAAAEAASRILRAITGAGGFTVRPLGTQPAPLSEIFGHDVPVAGQCLLLLFGAYPGGPPTREVTFFLLLHLAGVILGALGIATAVWRLCRGRGSDLVSQVLLAGITVNLGAFLVTQRAVDVTSAREIAPVLPFAAALAARQLSPGLARLLGHRAAVPGPPGSVNAGVPRLAARLLVVVGVGYAAGLGVELTAPSAPPQAAQLTAWLTRHHLGGYGLGGYWQASVVTLASGGTVAVRPITGDGSGVRANHGEIKDSWFDPRRCSAHFVVLSPGAPGYPGYADYPAVRATWGAPGRVYHVGQYTIWYWPKNLLSAILSGGQT
jgi:hypothetical protein